MKNAMLVIVSKRSNAMSDKRTRRQHVGKENQGKDIMAGWRLETKGWLVGEPQDLERSS